MEVTLSNMIYTQISYSKYITWVLAPKFLKKVIADKIEINYFLLIIPESIKMKTNLKHFGSKQFTTEQSGKREIKRFMEKKTRVKI